MKEVDKGAKDRVVFGRGTVSGFLKNRKLFISPFEDSVFFCFVFLNDSLSQKQHNGIINKEIDCSYTHYDDKKIKYSVKESVM